MDRHPPDGADGDFGGVPQQYRSRRFLSYADLAAIIHDRRMI